MSAELPSSNPFRRKTSSNLPSNAPGHPTTSHTIPQPNGPGSLNTTKLDTGKRIVKKVRVQSPPLSPSAPSLPDSSSTIGQDAYTSFERAPTPPIPQQDDPFDSVISDTSEEGHSGIPSRAPANPFSKTLETMEHPMREGSTPASTSSTNTGRASMNVEAFKRLLMTGDSGLAQTSPSATAAHVAHALGDGGSSTETSSISRHSLFETVQGPPPESPRTSHEISEPEDDRRGLVGEASHMSAGRRKPPPPSSRHGKLIKVELRDEGVPSTLHSPPTPGSITSQHYFTSAPRSQTDLNKPLPPAPNRASHDSDRESVFDKESAGKTPEPPSPSAFITRKNPPAPPLARRHSQMVAESKLSRGSSMRLSPRPEEDSSEFPAFENRRPSSESMRGPPPPPSRRPGSIHRGASHTALSSPSSTSLPTPPPARGSSRSLSGGKAPSFVNVERSPSVSKRVSMMAPPPPPPRHRNSMEAQSADTSRRPSGEHARQSLESGRRESTSSSLVKETEPHEAPSRNDILADLTKLQREIDALRTQSGHERVT